MAWDITQNPPETVDEVLHSWKAGLAAKPTMETHAWIEQATALRSLAASLRDSILAVSPEHGLLATLVDEITAQLPERRVTIRP